MAAHAALAQETAFTDCGSLANHYGPFDYTNPEHFRNNLPIVEAYHFTSEVEELIKGHTGDIELDLDYTLRTFPNHHRALYSVARFQLLRGYRRMQRYLPADCYFERAMQFKPDDGMVRMIYGIYLHRKGNLSEALQRYNEAFELMPDASELQYNLGLLYCDMNDFKTAKEHADKAYAAGYPLPGLRNRLIRAGVWSKDAIQSGVKTK